MGGILSLDGADPDVIAIAGVVALGLILVTLAAMYIANPAFLTIEGPQASNLAVIQELIRRYGRSLPESVLLQLASGIVVDTEPVAPDKIPSETPEQGEIEEIEQELGALGQR
ncbi:hypothetical protein, partial [Streptococcus pseudopneumoniae]|uniref:hypothetical protein n=1 Tax=Streptococcus pseudopneumoniae TaxID=257758 RepID=UPI00110C3628